MEFQAEETHGGTAQQPFHKQYKLFHAAIAQFCYTGAQVGIASFFINYVGATRPGTSDSLSAKFFAGAQAAFAIGRFAGVAIMKYVKPRQVFIVFITCCVIFLCPSLTQRGNTGMAMLYVVLFFESICFPTIVALGMRGLGRHSKRGSGYIVAGVCGAAIVPPATGAAADHLGTGYCMFVPLIFMALAWTYAACVNFVPSYRDVVDSFGQAKVGLDGSDGEAGPIEKPHQDHLGQGEKAVEAESAVARPSV